MKRIWVLTVAMALCASIVLAADAGSASGGLTWRHVRTLAIAQETESCAGAESSAVGCGPQADGATQVVRATCAQSASVRLSPPQADGRQFVATDPSGAPCPHLTGPIDTTTGTSAAFDLPIRWLYETDNLVTGQSFAEIGQTFTATGAELEKVTCFIATGPDAFDVAVRKDGPNGGGRSRVTAPPYPGTPALLRARPPTRSSARTENTSVIPRLRRPVNAPSCRHSPSPPFAAWQPYPSSGGHSLGLPDITPASAP